MDKSAKLGIREIILGGLMPELPMPRHHFAWFDSL